LGKTVDLVGGEVEREMEMAGLVFRRRREGLGQLRDGQLVLATCPGGCCVAL
jgi:hypothetical protein